MAETLCSCCALLGKPPARVNFIITTGVPDSLVYDRIRYLLRHFSESPSRFDAHLTNYESLMDVSTHLFTSQNASSAVNEQAPSSPTQTCCHGFTSMSLSNIDLSNSFELETLRNDILDFLDPSSDAESEEKGKNPKKKSWIIIYGSTCLEAALLKIFLDLETNPSTLLDFTLTMLCFLVDEQRLFENWIYQNLSIEDYQLNTYPEYERSTNDFFSLLNKSTYLQKNTLLIREETVLNDHELQTLLQKLFPRGWSEYRANNEQLRRAMSRLLFRKHRNVRDIRRIRSVLQKGYHSVIENRLRPLLDGLQQPTTAANAARQIANIILNEFERTNEEELRAYKRILTLSLKSNHGSQSKTIAQQLVHYALQLLTNYDESNTALIYSIVLSVCVLGSHFYFRHEFFNTTPEIYPLSLLLVTQRHYALTLAGLRLCITILHGDRSEHKYAIAYLTHDPLAARKILDAVKWLLSPYASLSQLWEEEDAKDKTDKSDSDHEQSSVLAKERFCIRHAGVLLERAHLRGLTALFHGSADHCAKATEDDVRTFANVIQVLTDRRLTSWSRGESKSSISLALASWICTFLTPLLQYSQPSVTRALQNEHGLLSDVPRAIDGLLLAGEVDPDLVNPCLRFYARFVQLICKQEKSNDVDSDDEKQEDQPSSAPSAPVTPVPDALHLSRDLISSYFDLYQRVQRTVASDGKLAQEAQVKAFFDQDWKRLDTLRLQHDHEQLQRDQSALKDELSQLRNELQRAQSERDEFRKEKTKLAQEIDHLQRAPPSNTAAQPEAKPAPVSTENDNQSSIIDELQNLSSLEITATQAEQCIREIYRRRTTFSDPDMRKSICGSLKHLGSDLYSSSVHFLHELIQNAEDNFYDTTIVPCLRIELNHSYILLSNNERGLRTRDVLALCSLAVSTKSIQEQHIGEKGVGFKSVFAASNQPTLVSHAWKFGFQVPGVDAMAYITPLWIHDRDIPECISKQVSGNPQDTHLYLPLKFPAQTPNADLFLDQVARAADPCILLNMRQLTKLEIIDQRHEKITLIEKQLMNSTKLQQQSSITFEDFTFTDLRGSLVRLGTSPSFNTFRVYTCYVDVPNSIEQRRSPRTRLIMAFPCESDYCLTSTVYTGLPVCDLGFNFLFNAEFQLVTSRENVRENAPLNSFIRDHLATLFVYLLLNDPDLRKDIHRYCPSSHTHQVKHSSWWLVMIDRINELITKYLPMLFDIQSGKTIRHSCQDLASLVSNEQLYDCADIQVINADDHFLTPERLKSFRIQPVSAVDVLSCFPSRDATTPAKSGFRSWTQVQNERWWSQLFHHLSQNMTPDLADQMLQKPIFRLTDDQRRDYLPATNHNTRLLLFITDDPLFRMWKRQLTLLQYSSSAERSALHKSNHVQLLTEDRMIELIRLDHVDLSRLPLIVEATSGLIEEIWNDLIYLQSRLEKLDRSTPFLVPVTGTPKLAPIQNALLPTVLGIDVRSYMHPIISSTVLLPYYNSSHHSLASMLKWEHFLLKMNCQRPSIHLPADYRISQLPMLPPLTAFDTEKCARLGELILAEQTQNTKDCLRQFPILDNSKPEQQISPISATFDEAIVQDLPSLPRITIPPDCQTLAKHLDVCIDYDLRTCVTVLQLLTDEKNQNIDLFVQWLGRLQLYVRQQRDRFDPEDLLRTCQLYLPDQDQFYSLKELLVIPDNEKYQRAIACIAKNLKLQLISPSHNQIYWQFKELFNFLNCTCAVRITHIYQTIQLIMDDKSNFFALGDCLTTLTDNGTEMMITLLQYLEDLIRKCVDSNKQDHPELYRAVIEDKSELAPCGSREDLEWRFGITCNAHAAKLKQLVGLQSQQEKVGLLTIKQELVPNQTDNIIYACLETKIIQSLSKTVGKRHYIMPLIARTCPLVLATFGIDYIERRGKLIWSHSNVNLEYALNFLTSTFRDTLSDPAMEVITARYATVKLLHSDAFVVDLSTEQDEDEIRSYTVDTDYPFWIFNKTVLLCTGGEQSDSTKAIIATSALATLLHKRRHLPFEEAKTLARQQVATCTAFRSENLAHVASGGSTMYSYTDLLFPTDHQSFESMVISMGSYGFTERDTEDDTSSMVAADRSATDQIYRNLVRTHDHTHRRANNPANWTDPSIVDGMEQITIGRNAEHYFFTYLQKCYGTVDVTPIKNWRSSARLITYPDCQRNVSDSVGYDFELHDTREIFVQGTGSTSKYCYFEVKGTSGLFSETSTRFHISENELRVCESIADEPRRREREAYFIVIIQNCLDSENISFGTTINWSEDFQRVEGVPDSYQCRVVLPSTTNRSSLTTDTPRTYNQSQQHQSASSEGRNNNTAVQAASTNSGNATTNRQTLPPQQNPPQPSLPRQQNPSIQHNSPRPNLPRHQNPSGQNPSAQQYPYGQYSPQQNMPTQQYPYDQYYPPHQQYPYGQYVPPQQNQAPPSRGRGRGRTPTSRGGNSNTYHQ